MHKTPEMQKPLYSIKQAGSPVPTVPELYAWHLNQVQKFTKAVEERPDY